MRVGGCSAWQDVCPWTCAAVQGVRSFLPRCEEDMDASCCCAAQCQEPVPSSISGHWNSSVPCLFRAADACCAVGEESPG